MLDHQAIVEGNRLERERLSALVAGLQETDLQRQLEHGWTVSAALEHIAFYDRRTAGIIEAWRQQGLPTEYPAANIDALNAEKLRDWHSASPAESGQHAIAAARSTDEMIEHLPQEMVDAILERGWDRIINRARHRRMHLDEIEQTLGRGAGQSPR